MDIGTSGALGIQLPRPSSLKNWKIRYIATNHAPGDPAQPIRQTEWLALHTHTHAHTHTRKLKLAQNACGSSLEFSSGCEICSWRVIIFPQLIYGGLSSRNGARCPVIVSTTVISDAVPCCFSKHSNFAPHGILPALLPLVFESGAIFHADHMWTTRNIRHS